MIPYPRSLGRAFISYGRIFKTMHLLRYYSDEDYCRQILIQLNRGESRHTLCRAICYGKKGKIYKIYQKGQEETLGAFGLVSNIVIYWNTLYIEAALNQLKKKDIQLKKKISIICRHYFINISIL
ncbi:Tn3 family transposase [Enterococcus faecalis]|uniref:Tn3 family transposase n=1 Tax=Enterococcus TaxID=1350 RepID=UPI0013792A23|nr:transposase [Enterococcus faecalis]EGO2696240.1 transposase [Enterococcus faecalis]EGO5061157.1 transposase [Enterococcus faecalis]EGO6066119.1 transposase [Enterococcus faecalis]EHS7923982.1 Tn3 family transposase [Enterococcus faecalis]